MYSVQGREAQRKYTTLERLWKTFASRPNASDIQRKAKEEIKRQEHSHRVKRTENKSEREREREL